MTDHAGLTWPKLILILVIVTLTGLFVSVAHVVSVSLRESTHNAVLDLQQQVADLKAGTDLAVKPKDVLEQVLELQQAVARLEQRMSDQ